MLVWLVKRERAATTALAWPTSATLRIVLVAVVMPVDSAKPSLNKAKRVVAEQGKRAIAAQQTPSVVLWELASWTNPVSIFVMKVVVLPRDNAFCSGNKTP